MTLAALISKFTNFRNEPFAKDMSNYSAGKPSFVLLKMQTLYRTLVSNLHFRWTTLAFFRNDCEFVMINKCTSCTFDNAPWIKVFKKPFYHITQRLSALCMSVFLGNWCTTVFQVKVNENELRSEKHLSIGKSISALTAFDWERSNSTRHANLKQNTHPE